MCFNNNFIHKIVRIFVLSLIDIVILSYIIISHCIKFIKDNSCISLNYLSKCYVYYNILVKQYIAMLYT